MRPPGAWSTTPNGTFPMEKPYLVVSRLNQYAEPERTAIGPFATIHDMITFARAYHRASGQTDQIFGRSEKPWNVMTVAPDALFPWDPEQIPDCPKTIAQPITPPESSL